MHMHMCAHVYASEYNNLYTINLIFSVCIAGHIYMNPVGFGECRTFIFSTGAQKRILKSCRLWN